MIKCQTPKWHLSDQYCLLVKAFHIGYVGNFFRLLKIFFLHKFLYKYVMGQYSQESEIDLSPNEIKPKTNEKMKFSKGQKMSSINLFEGVCSDPQNRHGKIYNSNQSL